MPFRLAALRAGWSWKPAVRLQFCDPFPDSNRQLRPAEVRRGPGVPAPARARHTGARRRLPGRTGQGCQEPALAVCVARVTVEGEARWVLSADADKLASEVVGTTGLLGAFDLFQARDRPVLGSDPAQP